MSLNCVSFPTVSIFIPSAIVLLYLVPLTPNPLVQIPPVTKYLFIEGYLYKKAGTADWINLFCTHAFLFKM